ncbi:MAG: glycosyltransferase family 2 protein [Bacilli bacterium]|nr:glycosyltransferase family 2 protein [Bacilli bacterium]
MATVSVIIPSYGKPVYLKEAILSVIQQSFLDWELIVVDDNDPNSEARKETEALMASFLADVRLKYVKHPSNLNGAAARNTGISQAKGRYIAFLDSDDRYLPSRLEKCVALMEKEPTSIAGVYTGCEFYRNGKKYSAIKNVKSGNFLVDTLASTFVFCTGSNLFIRQGVVKELSGFDQRFIRHQDYEFLARLFAQGYGLAAIKECLVVKNNENLNLPDTERLIEVKNQYLEKYASLIGQLSKKEQQYILHKQWLSVAEIALRKKEKDISAKYYRKAREYGGLTLMEMARRVAFSFIQR